MEVDDAPAKPDREVKAEQDDDDDVANGSGDVRMADSANGSSKPTYKSWKKKYRKMRIIFDQKMHEGEELHRQELKALATANRIAVQNDRYLEILLEINNTVQIPPEKRIDLSMDKPTEKKDAALFLDMDDQTGDGAKGPEPRDNLRRLLRDVPHYAFGSAQDRFPTLYSDLAAGRDSPADPSRGGQHPPSFLTADDIDNYLWEIDTRIAARAVKGGDAPLEPLPTMAPLAHANGNTPSVNAAALANGRDAPGAGGEREGRERGEREGRGERGERGERGRGRGGGGGADADGGPNAIQAAAAAAANRDFALRNPTSVYNWLRKHAPKVFLQDEEKHPDKENGTSGGGGDDGHHATPSTSRARGAAARQSGSAARQSGGAASERRARGEGRAKRASAAAAAAAAAAESVDDDYAADTPTAPRGRAAAAAANKRKRRAKDEDDEDGGGYRPKGGSSRPAKKKRRSDGDGGDKTPTAAAPPAKRPRKSGGASGRGGGGGGEEKEGGGGKGAAAAAAAASKDTPMTDAGDD